jgi:hypothetical protein
VEKIGGKDLVGMPGLSDLKVSRGSPQRQMEKRKAEEEKRMNWIKNLDGRKKQKNKGENEATRRRDFHSGCSGMPRRFPA